MFFLQLWVDILYLYKLRIASYKLKLKHAINNFFLEFILKIWLYFAELREKSQNCEI